MTPTDTLRNAKLIRSLPRFVANHIDLDRAQDLSDADLQDTGVAPFWHRRKLLKSFVIEGHALIEQREVVVLLVDLPEFTKLIRSGAPKTPMR